MSDGFYLPNVYSSASMITLYSTDHSNRRKFAHTLFHRNQFAVVELLAAEANNERVAAIMLT